ncbi:MAG: phage capsid scaffolding protein [Silanimonas sp.]|nr:MAG: phage capsid scaffolding protein [Silanimonas sp.]
MATKSKFFRVFVEGDTTDGRVIKREWIEQIARTYDRGKYGARVWLEHFRGIVPDSPFRAYGDVTAVRAGEVEIDGQKRLALYAQIDPTPDLVRLTKERQKIYTSAEVDTNFAKSGEAYLVGLAITDSPASLGTEVLTFAAQNPQASPFSGRKQSPENLFTAATEVQLAFEAESAMPEPLLSRIRDLFSRRGESDDRRFAEITEAVEALAGTAATLSVQLDAEVASRAAEYAAIKAALDAVEARLDALDHTEAPHPRRPTATGGAGAVLTDC